MIVLSFLVASWSPTNIIKMSLLSPCQTVENVIIKFMPDRRRAATGDSRIKWHNRDNIGNKRSSAMLCVSLCAPACLYASVFGMLNVYTIRCIPWQSIQTWFERISMAIILLNCTTLGLYKPCVDERCDTNRCRILEGFDHLIFVFFAVEMCTKVMAMGLVGKKTYLAETWNRLDMFIVFAG